MANHKQGINLHLIKKGEREGEKQVINSINNIIRAIKQGNQTLSNRPMKGHKIKLISDLCEALSWNSLPEKMASHNHKPTQGKVNICYL